MSRTAPTFMVRAAHRADAAAMPALEQSAGELFRNLPDLAHVADGENLGAQRYRTLVDGGWCRVAEDDRGDLCAFLCAEQHGTELHICEFAVRLDRQRLGLGRKLMTVTIREAQRRRIDAVTLTTFSDVAWNAPFYERLGFRRLHSRNMGARLRAVLRSEAQAGLPIWRRCAMRLILASNDEETRMEHAHRFPVTDAPAAADLAELDDRINDHNADRTGIRDARYLSIMLRSEDGALFAGLHGHSWGGCCEIKLLWVAENRRGKGLGGQLLRAAEDEAIRRGCHLLLLATHSFQAPGFYERLGFSRIATVAGYPAGHSEIFMTKPLSG